MTIQKRTHTIVRQRSPSKRHEALFVSTPALDADLCGFRSCPISGRVLRCRADALGRNAAFRSKSAYAAYALLLRKAALRPSASALQRRTLPEIGQLRKPHRSASKAGVETKSASCRFEGERCLTIVCVRFWMVIQRLV